MEFISGDSYVVDAQFGSQTEGVRRMSVKLKNAQINGTVVTADFGPNDHKLASMRGCTGCGVFTATLEGGDQSIPIQITKQG